MQIEPKENASKRMCTSQFSNRFVIAAAPHSGTHRSIGLQRVEANDLTLPTRFSVRGKDEIRMDRTQTMLGSGFVTPMSGNLDETPFQGDRELAAGRHEFVPERPTKQIALLWARAWQKGYSPFKQANQL